jgi:hypothetical protein
MNANSDIPMIGPPLLLAALCVYVIVYRKALAGEYQMGMHIQAIGFAIALVGLGVAVYADLGKLGARLGIAGFVIGLIGAVIQIVNRKRDN